MGKFIKDIFSPEQEEIKEVKSESKQTEIAKLIADIRSVIDNPVVEELNEKVTAPALYVIGVANVAAGVQLPNILIFLKYIFGQPIMVLRRRKKKKWGVVYNAYTKQPVDLAAVRIINDETGKVVRTQVTDTHGRYFIAVDEGRYKIEIIKPGFVGLSEFMKEKDEDAKYIGLYHGESFEIVGSDNYVTYNIPVDPEVADKPTKSLLRDHSTKIAQNALSIIGLAASIFSFIISPNWYIGLLVVLHVLFYVMFYKFAHAKLPSKWGVITEKSTKKLLGKVVVRVFDSEYDKLVNTSISDRKGRYAVLVGPSRYYLNYDKPGYLQKKSKVLDFSSKKTEGMGGIISRNEELEKGKNTKVEEDEDVDVSGSEVEKTASQEIEEKIDEKSLIENAKQKFENTQNTQEVVSEENSEKEVVNKKKIKNKKTKK